MSTIGVGKAFRDQAREGRRARSRREERVTERRARTREDGWEHEDEASGACTGCGIVDPVAEMYTGTMGLECANCFAHGEGEIAAPAVWTMRASVAWPLLYVPFLFFPQLWYQWGGVNLFRAPSIEPLESLLLLFWMALLGGAMAGAPVLLLFLAEQVRDALRRPGLDQTERTVAVFGHLWHGSSVAVMVLAALYTATQMA